MGRERRKGRSVRRGEGREGAGPGTAWPRPLSPGAADFPVVGVERAPRPSTFNPTLQIRMLFTSPVNLGRPEKWRGLLDHSLA